MEEVDVGREMMHFLLSVTIHGRDVRAASTG